MSCSSHNDCSQSLISLSGTRTYCCGGSFCCTAEQWQQGLTRDPFIWSAGAIIGIVGGIMVFFLIIGAIIWCAFKNKNRRKKSRRNNRTLEMAAYPGPYSASTLPGHSTNAVHHDYDFPPEFEDIRSKPSSNPHYGGNSHGREHRNPSRPNDNSQTISSDYRRTHDRHKHRDYDGYSRERDYYDSTPRSPDHYKSSDYPAGNVEYLGSDTYGRNKKSHGYYADERYNHVPHNGRDKRSHEYYSDRRYDHVRRDDRPYDRGYHDDSYGRRY